MHTRKIKMKNFRLLLFSAVCLASSACSTNVNEETKSFFTVLTEPRSDVSTEEGRREREKRMKRRQREQRQAIHQISRAARIH